MRWKRKKNLQQCEDLVRRPVSERYYRSGNTRLSPSADDPVKLRMREPRAMLILIDCLSFRNSMQLSQRSIDMKISSWLRSEKNPGLWSLDAYVEAHGFEQVDREPERLLFRDYL